MGEVQLRPFLTAAADGGDFNSQPVTTKPLFPSKDCRKRVAGTRHAALVWGTGLVAPPLAVGGCTVHFTWPLVPQEWNTCGLQHSTDFCRRLARYRSAGKHLCPHLLSRNLKDRNQFADRVSRDVVHRPYQGILYFQNDVWLHGTRRHAVLLKRIRYRRPLNDIHETYKPLTAYS